MWAFAVRSLMPRSWAISAFELPRPRRLSTSSCRRVSPWESAVGPGEAGPRRRIRLRRGQVPGRRRPGHTAAQHGADGPQHLPDGQRLGQESLRPGSHRGPHDARRLIPRDEHPRDGRVPGTDLLESLQAVLFPEPQVDEHQVHCRIVVQDPERLARRRRPEHDRLQGLTTKRGHHAFPIQGMVVDNEDLRHASRRVSPALPRIAAFRPVRTCPSGQLRGASRSSTLAVASRGPPGSGRGA